MMLRPGSWRRAAFTRTEFCGSGLCTQTSRTSRATAIAMQKPVLRACQSFHEQVKIGNPELLRHEHPLLSPVPRRRLNYLLRFSLHSSDRNRAVDGEILLPGRTRTIPISGARPELRD